MDQIYTATPWVKTKSLGGSGSCSFSTVTVADSILLLNFSKWISQAQILHFWKKIFSK